MANALVIGMGEVGKALTEVLATAHRVFTYDAAWQVQESTPKPVQVMHIAFPCNDRDSFVAAVQRYQAEYSPRYTIVHSTVFPGTTAAIGGNTFYSPVRGVHPRLAEGLTTFDTFIGNKPSPNLGDWLTHYLVSAGFKVQWEDASSLEAAKLWSLAQYAASILVEKEIHAYCKQRGLDFDTVYTFWNHSYNRGYQELGMPWVTRPVLIHQDGPIGGHCVMPAVEKLMGDGAPLASLLWSMNESLKPPAGEYQIGILPLEVSA